MLKKHGLEIKFLNFLIKILAIGIVGMLKQMYLMNGDEKLSLIALFQFWTEKSSWELLKLFSWWKKSCKNITKLFIVKKYLFGKSQ